MVQLAGELRRVPQVIRPWVQNMLSQDASQRPTARDVVEGMKRYGAHVPPARVDTLAARAQQIPPIRSDLTPWVKDWFGSGGALGIVGPSGSGRTQMMDALACRLSAEDQTWRRMNGSASDDRWAEELQTLSSTRTLPGEPIHVLIDQAEDLDPSTGARIARLVSMRTVAVCLAGAHMPAWVDRCVELQPMTHTETRDHLRRLIGRVQDVDLLVEAAHKVTDGRPTRVTSLVLATARAGGICYEHHHWHPEPATLQMSLRIRTSERPATWDQAPAGWRPP